MTTPYSSPSGRGSQGRSGATGHPISGIGTRMPCAPTALNLQTGFLKRSSSSISLTASGSHSRTTVAHDISRSSGTSRSTSPTIASTSGQIPDSSNWMDRKNRLLSQVSPRMTSVQPGNSGETRSTTGRRTRCRGLHGGRAGSTAPSPSSTGCASTISVGSCSTGRFRPARRAQRTDAGSMRPAGSSSPCLPGAGHAFLSSLRISATSPRMSTR